MHAHFAIALVFVLGCSATPPERAETVATLATPPPRASTHVAAPHTDGWPCVKPPVLTEHQEATLEQMTKSGRPELVEQAAGIRAKLCAGWAQSQGNP
ncbi:MAG TPA: hypothetical protein VH054_04470 [Polyangiaceae bacterium]|jgi:hypothetical protein|nr:hypothetical protein [Polyangiaceae bacterium]